MAFTKQYIHQNFLRCASTLTEEQITNETYMSNLRQNWSNEISMNFSESLKSLEFFEMRNAIETRKKELGLN